MKIASKFLSFTLIGLRPLLGPAVCKFPIGCTDFALSALQELPLHKALAAIFKRILSCSPLKP